VYPVAPVFPVAPFSACAPVAPVAPVAPAGPGGVTTVVVGLSHALNASAITAADNTIEYFMRIPFDCLTKTAHLDRFAANWSCSPKVRHFHVQFRTLAYITLLQSASQNLLHRLNG
jgi:hypothetical protein